MHDDHDQIMLAVFTNKLICLNIKWIRYIDLYSFHNGTFLFKHKMKTIGRYVKKLINIKINCK